MFVVCYTQNTFVTFVYYHLKLEKGPLFREGTPRAQTLRFNIHNNFVFEEGLTVRRSHMYYKYHCDIKDIVK